MLDWFSGYVGYDASQLAFGKFFEIDAGGSIVRQRDRWETARGSFESGIQVTRGVAPEGMSLTDDGRPHGFLCSRDCLRLSGNPSKFLQGHNVAGPSVSLLGPVLQATVRSFADGLRPLDADQETLPAVRRTRVDCNVHCDLGSHQAVHDWLKLAATTTRSRHGRAIDSKGTVYWGQGSTRWTFKAYCKHCELLQRPFSDPRLQAEFLNWTRTHLRLEVTLRRPELKDRGTLSEAVVWEFFSRLEVNAMKQGTSISDLNLRPATKAALQLWYDSTVELSSFYPRTTFYRYRKEIIKNAGIDVSLPRVEQSADAMPVLLGMDELRDREVKDIPPRIQGSLFGAGQ